MNKNAIRSLIRRLGLLALDKRCELVNDRNKSKFFDFFPHNEKQFYKRIRDESKVRDITLFFRVYADQYNIDNHSKEGYDSFLKNYNPIIEELKDTNSFIEQCEFIQNQHKYVNILY